MNSRERIRTIISGQPADRVGFWLGNPHADSWPLYHEYFGTTTQEEVRQKLGDDYRWIPAGIYAHPEGKSLFQIEGKDRHAYAGPFADATDVRQLDEYDWPRVEYLDFSPILDALRNTGDHYRASGFWTPFYHNVMDLFGMESYLVNMYENPTIVEAVTDRVCQFYYEANELFFAAAGGKTFFFWFSLLPHFLHCKILGNLAFGKTYFDPPWGVRLAKSGCQPLYLPLLSMSRLYT